jgi:hypothetical protein
MTEKTEKYRLDTAYGKLYEWDEDKQSYVFVLSTSANYIEDAIKEYNKYDSEELFGWGQ